MYKIKYDIINPLLIDNIIEPSETEMTERHEWFVKLEASIKQYGIRNPVILTAKLIDGEQSITPRYGGCRVMYAQKYNILVPSIIADFDNIFPNSKIIQSWEIEKYFKDKPKKIIPKENGINASGCPDIHMMEKIVE